MPLDLDEYDYFMGLLPRTLTLYVIPVADIKARGSKVVFRCDAKYINAFDLLPPPA